MKTLIKTLALAAALVGFASCGSNPEPNPGGSFPIPPVTVYDGK